MTETTRVRISRLSRRRSLGTAYIGLAHLELAVREGTEVAATAAARLHDYAVRADLPGFRAWALLHQAESGDHSRVPLARTAAEGVANPVLQARVQALGSHFGGSPT